MLFIIPPLVKNKNVEKLQIKSASWNERSVNEVNISYYVLLCKYIRVKQAYISDSIGLLYLGLYNMVYKTDNGLSNKKKITII